jgi:hypothetical protein
MHQFTGSLGAVESIKSVEYADTPATLPRIRAGAR